MEIFNLPFWVFVAVIAGIYTIFALGLYLQFALAGLPNFGHVAFAALAAYTMAILIIHLNVPMPLAALAGLLAAVLFALVLGIPPCGCAPITWRSRPSPAPRSCATWRSTCRAHRRPDRLHRHARAEPARAVQPIVGSLAAPHRRSPERNHARPAASRDFAMLLIVWATALILLVVFWLMVRSPWGRMMRAIREDEGGRRRRQERLRAKLQVLILGALLGGLAGLLLACRSASSRRTTTSRPSPSTPT